MLQVYTKLSVYYIGLAKKFVGIPVISCMYIHIHIHIYIYIYTHAYTFSDFLPNYNYYTLLEDIEFSNSKFFWTPFLDTIESPGNSSEKQCSIGGS